jgi:hypothetical protein
MRRLSVLVILIIAAAIAVVAIVYRQSAPLDPKIAAAYVDAQAHALCLVQSNAYPTQTELEAAYKRSLQSTTLSAHEFAQAQGAAEQDAALRTRVSDRVAALCG